MKEDNKLYIGGSNQEIVVTPQKSYSQYIFKNPYIDYQFYSPAGIVQTINSTPRWQQYWADQEGSRVSNAMHKASPKVLDLLTAADAVATGPEMLEGLYGLYNLAKKRIYAPSRILKTTDNVFKSNSDKDWVKKFAAQARINGVKATDIFNLNRLPTFSTDVTKGIDQKAIHELMHNTIERNIKELRNLGYSEKEAEEYRQLAQNIMKDVNVGRYSKQDYVNAGQETAGGFYDNLRNFISVNLEHNKMPPSYIESHEGRHLLDYKLPISTSERQQSILSKAYDDDFITIPESKFADGLENYKHMNRERVTTNRDAREKMLRNDTFKFADHNIQEKMINKLSDEQIFEAVEQANGYGRRYIQRLRAEGKLTKDKADALRRAAIEVGSFAGAVYLLQPSSYDKGGTLVQKFKGLLKAQEGTKVPSNNNLVAKTKQFILDWAQDRLQRTINYTNENNAYIKNNPKGTEYPHNAKWYNNNIVALRKQQYENIKKALDNVVILTPDSAEEDFQYGSTKQDMLNFFQSNPGTSGLYLPVGDDFGGKHAVYLRYLDDQDSLLHELVHASGLKNFGSNEQVTVPEEGNMYPLKLFSDSAYPSHIRPQYNYVTSRDEPLARLMVLRKHLMDKGINLHPETDMSMEELENIISNYGGRDDYEIFRLFQNDQGDYNKNRLLKFFNFVDNGSQESDTYYASKGGVLNTKFNKLKFLMK